MAFGPGRRRKTLIFDWICDTAKGPDAGDSQTSKGEARGLAEGQR